MSAITSTPLTDIRSDNAYRAFQFVCTVPNEVVVQFNPDSAPTVSVYAELAVGAVVSGDMADIEEAQTVIFSTTSDYQATEVFRTRVRKVDGTTVLYIGEISQTITITDYVTVLNTYEIHEKLRKSETYADWDIPFRKLLPIETALPSAVVLTNDEITYTPPANAIVMDFSASTIDTHAWSSSNPNDSFDDDTIAQPEITLEAEAFRWLRYTFTDDLGQSNFRVLPVWTVPKDYNTVVALGFVGESGDVADISFDADLGWTASVPAWTGIADLIDKTYTVIACDEWYNDTRQSIRTNINFVGFLQNENNATSGDESAGAISETTFTIEGFGHQIARQNIAPIRITRVAGTPTVWNEVQNPTPARMITYHASEGSTLLHLCSLSIPSDDADFVGDDLSVTSGKLLDDIRFIGEVINAELQFDCDGRLDLCRNLNFLDDTARDAAPVVATLTIADYESFTDEIDYSSTTATLDMTGGAYDSAGDVYDLYQAIAPASARLGEGDPLEIANQVLTTDSTPAEALTEISERAANFFAYNNPTWLRRVVLKGEWYFPVPDVGSWFKFTQSADETARGRVFGDSDRWQLVEISYSTNSETGQRTVNASFRHETQSTGAIVRASPIVNDAAGDIIYFPAVLPPFTGGDLDLTDGEWWDSQDPTPPSETNPSSGECENGGFRPKTDGSYATGTPALNGELVQITVRGSGQLKEVGANSLQKYYVQDFSTGLGAWSLDMGALQGDGVHGTKLGETDFKQYELSYALPATVTMLGMRQTVSHVGGIGNGSNDFHTVRGYSDLAETTQTVFNGGGFYVTADHEQPCTNHVGDPQVITLAADGRVEQPNYPSTETVIHMIELWMADDAPIGIYIEALSNVCTGTPVAASKTWYGDAFYFWSDDDAPRPFADGQGLMIEFLTPPSIPPYSETHEYNVELIVTSGPVLYEYESPFGNSNMDNWSLQITTCFEGVPA
jgi:hypothetical protein